MVEGGRSGIDEAVGRVGDNLSPESMAEGAVENVGGIKLTLPLLEAETLNLTIAPHIKNATRDTLENLQKPNKYQ